MSKKTQNFRHDPILGGCMFVTLCFVINIQTLMVIFPVLNIITDVQNFTIEVFNSNKFHKVILAAICLGFIMFYYHFRGKAYKIVEKYDELAKDYKFYRLPAILVIVFYYIMSFGLFLVAKVMN